MSESRAQGRDSHTLTLRTLQLSHAFLNRCFGSEDVDSVLP